MNKETRLEIFCGTGGVGKTTLSFTKALSLKRKGLEVIVITIDPARRLRDFISQNNEGLEVHLFNPLATFKKLTSRGEHQSNRILDHLMGRLGGMNEILSLIELSSIYNSKKYDVIVLDTPPGKHFLDFLESSRKIEAFFQKSFIDIFKFMVSDEKKSQGFFKKVVNSGINKVIDALEKVTGEGFVKEFIESLGIIYDLKDDFLNALGIHKVFKDSSLTKWYLVSSTEQAKYEQAKALTQNTILENKNIKAVLNRTLPKIELHENIDTKERNLISHYQNIEEKLLKKIQNDFQDIIKIKHIESSNLNEQVNQLTKIWINHE